jgi:hypothetical protein
MLAELCFAVDRTFRSVAFSARGLLHKAGAKIKNKSDTFYAMTIS